MKVLIVSPWSETRIGGVVETITNVARGLSRHGDEVSMLIGGDSDRIQPEDSAVAATWSTRLRSPQPSPGSIRAVVAFLICLIPTLLRLRGFLRRGQFDIVNVHFPSSQHIYFYLLRQIMPFKLVVSVHGSDIRVHYHWNRLNRWLTRCLLKYSDAVVCCSRDLLNYTASALGGHANKRMEVVYGGVDVSWLAPADVVPGVAAEPYIIFVGALREVKGVDILIRSFARLDDRFRDNRLLIVGDGKLRSELERLAEEMGVAGRVTFAGVLPHDELAERLRRSLFAVISSRHEGLSLVAIETQAVGKPVIACRTGGLPELIDDGVNGLLFPAGNELALTEKIAYLLEHPEDRERMGKAGAERIRDRYTWDHATAAYQRLFRELVDA